MSPLSGAELDFGMSQWVEPDNPMLDKLVCYSYAINNQTKTHAFYHNFHHSTPPPPTPTPPAPSQSTHAAHRVLGDTPPTKPMP